MSVPPSHFHRYLIFIVAFSLLAACSSAENDESDETASVEGGSVVSGTPAGGTSTCTSNTAPVFSTHLTDLSMIDVIVPPGCVNCGELGRSYIHPSAVVGATGTEVPIYAPVDMNLVRNAKYIPIGAPEGYTPEWALYFEVSCEVTLHLAHVKGVADVIAATAPGAASNSSASNQLPQKIAFKAGEKIGYWKKILTSLAFDFVVSNTGKTNTFANQARYEAEGSGLLHDDCPYDYFATGLKTGYYDLFGTASVGKVAGMTCRSASRDKAGTLAGRWFTNPDASTGFGAEANTEFLGNPLTIAVDSPGQILFRNAPGASVLLSTGAPKDPALVTLTDPTYCYQLYATPTDPKGYVYFRVLSSSEMRAVHATTGLCPGTFPESGGTSYYR